MERSLRLHVYPVIGDVPIAKVTPGMVQQMVSGWRVKLAASTSRTLYRHLSSCFRAAVRYRLILASPCADIDLPAVGGARVDTILTVDQVAALAGGIGKRYRAAVVLAAGAGLRVGEMRGLRVDRVDFLRRSVAVDAQLVGRTRMLSPPKSERSVRSVPVGSTVTDARAGHLAEFGPGPDGLLFGSAQGGPFALSSMREAWGRAAVRDGLPGWATWHDLRHFYASLLIHSGLDVKTVQNRLGHSSATTTLDLYGHLWPGDEDRTRNAVDGALGAALVPVSYPAGGLQPV